MNAENQIADLTPPFYAKWVNLPFAPARFPFFYGWVIVAVSTFSVICSIPGQTTGVSLFTDHLIEALGIDRSHLAAAYMIGTIASGFSLPYAGKLLDKIGVRFMSGFACLGLGLSLLILSQVDRISFFIQSFAASRYIPVAVVAFAFFLIRFFGQGNMTMVGRVAMGKWFNHWRGIATAIAGIPIAFSFNAAPWIMKNVIDAFGWRQACWFLAAIVGVLMGLMGLLLFRDKPEDCGLVMDGRVLSKVNPKKDAIHKVYHQFLRAEAVRTVSFWAFALGLATNGLILTAIVFHLTDIGEEMQRSNNAIVKMLFYTSFIAIPVRFLTSYLVDNTGFKLKWLLTCMSITMMIYTVGLVILNTTAGWWLTIACFGITSGLWGVLLNVTFPRYFGRDHLGAVSGLTMSIQVIASAIGPYLFSFGKNYLGSYSNTALVVLILPLSILILSFFAGNPQQKYQLGAQVSNSGKLT